MGACAYVHVYAEPICQIGWDIEATAERWRFSHLKNKKASGDAAFAFVRALMILG